MVGGMMGFIQTSRWCGIVVSIVQHMNEVTHASGPVSTRIGDHWPSFGGYTISVCNQPTRSTEPCISLGSLNIHVTLLYFSEPPAVHWLYPLQMVDLNLVGHGTRRYNTFTHAVRKVYDIWFVCLLSLWWQLWGCICSTVWTVLG